MDWPHFVEWLFYGILGGSAVYGVRILSNLETSVEELNVKIAVVIEKISQHEKQLDRHEISIEQLKSNK